MKWRNILKDDEDRKRYMEEYAHASVGATNPNYRTYKKEELKDLDDVVVSNGMTAKEYAQGLATEVVDVMLSTISEKEYDTLTWVTNDVRKVAFENVMEQLSDAMRDYFNVE